MINELQINENLVRYVVDTYDLPEKTRDRLARTALFRLRDNHVASFDEAYAYIDNLAMGIDELRQRYISRSLDQKVGETERTLHEVIGIEDKGIERLFEDEQNKRRKLSGQEVVECLSYCLDRQDTEVLSRLMEGYNLEFDVSWSYLLENAEQIGERIRQVAHRYEKDGVILIPRKPIVQLSFNPFEVEFEKNMGRRLTDEEISVIETAYDKFNGNANAAARHLGYADGTIRRYWRKLDFEVQEKKRFQDEDISRIILAYSKYGGNATVAARELVHGVPTIIKYWRNAGLKINPSSGALQEEKVARIISAHSEFNGIAMRAARKLGHGTDTVLRYWKSAGLDVKPANMGRPRDEPSKKEIEIEKKVISAYELYNGNASRAALELGHAIATVTKYWRKNNLEVRPQGWNGTDSKFVENE